MKVPDTNLGPCCICEGMTNVHTILMLEQKAPIIGHGWGCVVCDLPPDGATAVVCDACIEEGDVESRLRFACRGFPASEGRVAIDELHGEHQHDMRYHVEDEP